MTAAERIRLARTRREIAEHVRGFDSGYAAAIHDALVPGSRAHHEIASAAAVRSSVERGDAFAILRTSTELEGS